MKIEIANHDGTFRISDGPDDSPSYEAGDVQDFGNWACLEMNGEIYLAFVDEDGSTDGQIHKLGPTIPAEVETDCEFEFEDEDEDGEDDDEHEESD